MPKIWVATLNSNKVKEIQHIVGSEYEILSAREIDFYAPPEETGATFLENAKIKAKAFRPFADESDWVVGEDSGLEVEALDNLPGVHSARYAGLKASDLQNNDKLLKMLNFKKTSNRNAKYVCQLYALGPEEFECHGFCLGTISLIPKGKGGFGYDPLFIPDEFKEEGKTMAELSLKEKNKISHRKKAFLTFLDKIQSFNR